MPRFGGELGEDESGTQIRGGTRDGRTPQGKTGTWVQAEGGKGESKPTRERQQMQARGAGRRDKQRRKKTMTTKMKGEVWRGRPWIIATTSPTRTASERTQP